MRHITDKFGTPIKTSKILFERFVKRVGSRLALQKGIQISFSPGWFLKFKRRHAARLVFAS